MEEVDFTVKINGLMNFREGVSAVVCGYRGTELGITCCLQHTEPIGTTKDEGRGEQGEGGGGDEGRVDVWIGNHQGLLAIRRPERQGCRDTISVRHKYVTSQKLVTPPDAGVGSGP